MTTLDEWSERSKRGEVCGMVGCQNTPTTQCPTCYRHYCYDDVQNHFHAISDEEAAEQITTNENLR